MAGDATTLPVSAFTTAMTFSSHTAKRRRFLRSMARPEGDLHGARGQRGVSVIFWASNWTSSFLSSMLTKMLPLPSATANSGLPPRARVPATELSAPLMAVGFWSRPLREKTRLGEASQQPAFGLASAFTVLRVFRDFVSEITVYVCWT